ncbi:hypothetical protein PA598K_02583 [Paenibacillus sp. 598K]|nr:hypothetical protein PA598K_02583 [Paenibacillus sp. 598K]
MTADDAPARSPNQPAETVARSLVKTRRLTLPAPVDKTSTANDTRAVGPDSTTGDAPLPRTSHDQ